MAAKKSRTVYVCQECGTHSPKWLGRCSGCMAWSTLVEESVAPANNAAVPRASGPAVAVRLSEVQAGDEARTATGIAELDRVLGGGMVRGGLVLVGGDPGIGKSTLLLQAMALLAAKGQKVLYVTAEESPRQVKMRAERMGLMPDNLYLLAETDLDAVMAVREELKPQVMVMDSVQTIGVGSLESAVGSVAQIRAVTQKLMQVAKGEDVATFVVGHVTKEGTIAGPKVMEHMVDTVLYFEGERTGPYRILRAHKNRFGSRPRDWRLRDARRWPAPRGQSVGALSVAACQRPGSHRGDLFGGLTAHPPGGPGLGYPGLWGRHTTAHNHGF